jgi:hypothetical protein
MFPFVILIAQPDKDDLVHYYRLIVGETRYPTGNPLDRHPTELAAQSWNKLRAGQLSHAFDRFDFVARSQEHL